MRFLSRLRDGKLVTLTILHNHAGENGESNKTPSVELEIISDESQVEGLTSRKSKALFGLLSMEFNEISSSSTSNVSGSFSDYRFSSSDESFGSNNSRKSYHKTNGAIENFDLLLADRDDKKHEHRKSFASLVKFLTKISARKSSIEEPTKSILRRPTEYCFVRGISGLPMRVVKPPSTSTSCHRCCEKLMTDN